MILKSIYLQEVINRHPLSYITRIFSVNPIHSIGLLFGTITLTIVIIKLIYFLINNYYFKNDTKKVNQNISLSYFEILISILVIWPLSFLIGLTMIGLFGGGFQTRFLLPILPVTSILSGICIYITGNKLVPLICILFCYTSFHILYYSILYSPLVADFDVSVFDILNVILLSPLDTDKTTKDGLVKTYLHMSHYGFAIKF